MPEAMIPTPEKIRQMVDRLRINDVIGAKTHKMFLAAADLWQADIARAQKAEKIGDADAALILHPDGGQEILLPAMDDSAVAPEHVVLLTAIAARLTFSDFVNECFAWMDKQRTALAPDETKGPE